MNEKIFKRIYVFFLNFETEWNVNLKYGTHTQSLYGYFRKNFGVYSDTQE